MASVMPVSVRSKKARRPLLDRCELMDGLFEWRERLVCGCKTFVALILLRSRLANVGTVSVNGNGRGGFEAAAIYHLWAKKMGSQREI